MNATTEYQDKLAELQAEAMRKLNEKCPRIEKPPPTPEELAEQEHQREASMDAEQERRRAQYGPDAWTWWDQKSLSHALDEAGMTGEKRLAISSEFSGRYIAADIEYEREARQRRAELLAGPEPDPVEMLVDLNLDEMHREIRDDLIRKMHANGASYRQLSRWLDLSKSLIERIDKKADATDQPGETDPDEDELGEMGDSVAKQADSGG
jgi:hypothetical protein